MKYMKVHDILDKLDNCIRYNVPFSHIRFGDGGLKFIHSIFYKDVEQLQIIIEKEGLPKDKLLEILKLWGYYARKADCIDTPQIYFNGRFWPRLKKPGKSINLSTEYKMRMWRELYSRAEFDNDVYCNPESNCLMILDFENKRNLFDIMRDRKVCIITARPEVKEVLNGYDIDILKIVAQWQNHYNKCFAKVGKFIKNNATKYDFFMVAAGELGRIYTGMIKENGGRAVDVGFIIEYFLEGYLHPRFHQFINQSLNNKLELKLTQNGKKYEKYI